MSPSSAHIGTLGEKPLHASLKQWYASPEDDIEVPVDRFVIDIVRDDILIEIQTKGFSSLKPKVRSLLDQGHRLRIVYPVPIDKWIVKLDDDGTVVSRRRSPRHGDPTDVFAELVSIPEALGHSNFELEVLLIKEEEYRRHTDDKAWRRKGWMIIERRLLEVSESVLLSEPDDLVDLLPPGLPEVFTTMELSQGLAKPKRTAQRMAYCMRRMGMFVPVGKRGNSIEYRVV